MKFLKDLVTVANGSDYDIGRVMWCIGVLAFLGFSGWSVIAQGQHFDMQSFGIGFGAVMVAGGGALRLKHPTEPQ